MLPSVCSQPGRRPFTLTDLIIVFAPRRGLIRPSHSELALFVFRFHHRADNTEEYAYTIPCVWVRAFVSESERERVREGKRKREGDERESRIWKEERAIERGRGRERGGEREKEGEGEGDR